MKTNSIEISKLFQTNEIAIKFNIPHNYDNLQKINKIMDIVENGKELSVEIKQHRNKRSIDANGMLWVIMNKIAVALGTSKDEVYLEMLDRYGVFTHIVVKPSVVEKVKKEWRVVRELGSVVVNGSVGVQLQCYFGSSTYNTKEFSTLLEGVISEAKELGIDTISDTEKKTLLEMWENKGV